MNENPGSNENKILISRSCFDFYIVTYLMTVIENRQISESKRICRFLLNKHINLNEKVSRALVNY